ncbi:MAG: restriction endonuclease subunit S [Treponema sp.]|nr:restriction endonuclease subunit S [Treponema sp.]
MKEMKKLGEFIQPVDVRNTDLSVTRLLGLSINKCFIESIANTIGTDFRPYKIVKKGQFAYGPVTSRNGEKITIALLEEPECIISSSYAVFEITDTSKLLPEYLMLWFSRPEFDRYARYKSHGSVREIFDWDEMCRVELPVPDIKEQQKIVDTYNAITNRIQIKQKINENLEKAAQCLFEEMWNSDNSQELELSKLSELTSSKRVFFDEYVSEGVPFYRGGEITEKRKGLPISDPLFITEDSYKEKVNKYGVPKIGDILITAVGTIGNSYMVTEDDKFYFKDGNLIWFKNFKDNSNFIIYDFLNSKEFKKKIEQISIGSTQTALTISGLSKIKTRIPQKDDYEEYIKKSNTILRFIQNNNAELENMYKLREIVISQISKR